MAAERRVESEKDFASRGEMSLQIAQKKIPFRPLPESFRRIVKIKIDKECRDLVEFLTEIGEQLECSDRPNDALDTKRPSNSVKSGN